MDDEALAFLEKWIGDNVVPTDASLRAEKAEDLAVQCYREAADAGFSDEDLQAAAEELSEGSDLATLIEAALAKAGEEVDDDNDE
ncbi:unnamed protein product [Phaeothamnion confervicola]